MGEYYVGQAIAVGFGFTPQGWLPCDGSLLPISGNEPLFQLLGTTYGGDGQTNFALPNLSGALAMGAGSGPGRSTYGRGQAGGSEAITVNASQLGTHTHAFGIAAASGSANVPGPSVLVASDTGSSILSYAPPPATAQMSDAEIAPSGGNQPHENRQPVLAINYIICQDGLYPSQG